MIKVLITKSIHKATIGDKLYDAMVFIDDIMVDEYTFESVYDEALLILNSMKDKKDGLLNCQSDIHIVKTVARYLMEKDTTLKIEVGV